MKTFNELTQSQKEAAVKFAYETLHESFKLGLLEGNGIKPAKLHELAVDAAENGKYDDEGKPFIDPLEVPFYHQGGCV